MKKILVFLFAATLVAGCNVNDPIEEPTYAITVSNDGNGTGAATVGGTAATKATAGQTVTITATPTGDYAFKQWKVVSGDVTLSSTTTNPATFTMPAKNVEVKAEFEAIQRTVTMTNDGNGTATAEPANAKAGQTVTITATPTTPADYQFKQWVVVSGGVTLSNTTTSPATFTMPASAVEIKAEFKLTANAAANQTTVEYKLKESKDTRTFLAFTAPDGATIKNARVISGTVDKALVYDATEGYWTMPVLLDGANPAANMKFYYTVELDGATSTETYKELPFTGLAANTIGANYYENGQAVGQVWRIAGGLSMVNYKLGLIVHNDMVSAKMEYPGEEFFLTHFRERQEKEKGMSVFSDIKNKYPDTWEKLGLWKAATPKGNAWIIPTWVFGSRTGVESMFGDKMYLGKKIADITTIDIGMLFIHLKVTESDFEITVGDPIISLSKWTLPCGATYKTIIGREFE